MFFVCYFYNLCRHGGEEGVTCHVISLDSKSDQAAWATRIGMPRSKLFCLKNLKVSCMKFCCLKSWVLVSKII